MAPKIQLIKNLNRIYDNDDDDDDDRSGPMLASWTSLTSNQKILSSLNHNSQLFFNCLYSTKTI